MTDAPHSIPARADRPETPLRRGLAPVLVALGAGAGLFLACHTVSG